LKKEVQQLLRLAEQADGVNTPDGMSIPEELERRELRLAAIASAKAKIETRAEERLEREQAEHQSKLAAHVEQEKRIGHRIQSSRRTDRCDDDSGETGSDVSTDTPMDC
jgi:hypothetical protein